MRAVVQSGFGSATDVLSVAEVERDAFALGEAAFGFHPGALAEFVAVPVDALALKPAGPCPKTNKMRVPQEMAQARV
jgi:hypothetical protein